MSVHSMKDIFSGLDVKDSIAKNKTNDKPKDIETETGLLINQLFIRLCALFPAFKQAWPNQEVYNCAKRMWTAAFIESGLNNWQEIEKGLLKFSLLTNPFVPTAGQFIQMCKNEITPPKDTRNHEDFLLPCLEKERRIEIGKKAISSLLSELKAK